jgi:hypothetical protein
MRACKIENGGFAAQMDFLIGSDDVTGNSHQQ